MSNADCIKCNGTGCLPKFGHIAAGACFACGGTGKRVYRERTAPVAAKGERERLISYLAARIAEATRAEDRAEWASLWSTERDGYPRLLDTITAASRAGHDDVASRALAALHRLGITTNDL